MPTIHALHLRQHKTRVPLVASARVKHLASKLTEVLLVVKWLIHGESGKAHLDYEEELWQQRQPVPACVSAPSAAQ